MHRFGSSRAPSGREASRAARLTAALAGLLALALWAGSAASQPQLPDRFADQLLIGGLDRPVGIAFLPDGRLVVVELKTARVRMLVGGALAATDPIGVVDSVSAGEEEQGLLSVAVDPRWPAKPFVYVQYTAIEGALRVSRFTAVGDVAIPTSGNLALDPNSRRDLIRDIPDLQGNHNGGTLRFGPDSLLYASFGEDAFACTAIDSTSLHGVVVRMEVRNLPDTPGPPDKGLLVAAGNPFAAHPNVNTRLLWALGLRNPFRFHLDPPTGRLFIADVGWLTKEEVDLADGPGRDFGWPYYEGTTPYVTTECGPPAPPGLRPPIHEYNRSEWCPYPDPLDCAASIIGGVLYRPVPGGMYSFPADYDGDYFYSEYYGGFIRRLRDSGGTWTVAPVAAGQPSTLDWGLGYREATDWVIGPDGAIYYPRMAVNYQAGTGEIRRIVYVNPLQDVEARRSEVVRFHPAWPQPARGSAMLSFTLARPAGTRLTLYDATGRLVRRLFPDGRRDAGEHRMRWDGTTDSGRRVAAGVYLARLVVDGEAHEQRIAFLR